MTPINDLDNINEVLSEVVLGDIDEAYFGCDTTITRKMSISEYCSKGSLEGVVEHRAMRFTKLYDYAGILWAGVLLPLVGVTIVSVFAFRHINMAMYVFVAAALCNMIFQASRMWINNFTVTWRINKLRKNHLVMAVENTRSLDSFIENPTQGIIHTFYIANRYVADGAINRLDGAGDQIVFIEFFDECDRVVARLRQ